MLSSLNYWIESYDSSSANIWVELDSINPSTTNFYLYYGNASDISLSNGENTFSFFDDFSSETLDSEKWSTYKFPNAFHCILF